MRVAYFALLFILAVAVRCYDGMNPQHIHLSLSSSSSQMNVAWWTSEPTSESSVVQYGTDSAYTEEAPAVTTKITKYGSGYMHFATMHSLSPRTTYYYRVGCEEAWSREYSFRSKLDDKISKEDSVTMLAYGDMGVFPDSLDHLKVINKREVDSHQADLVLHVGDLAYAFENVSKWETWFENAEPIAARIPYMISYGNRDNESVWEERFAMPLDTSESNALLKPQRSRNFYYSFDYGWVHVVSITTIPAIFEYAPGSPQYEWLENDLRQASSRLHDSHDNLRWIVLMGHTPLYSSSDGHPGEGNKVLAGVIEHLLIKYNVSLALWGDDHMYERTYPVYDNVSYPTHKLIDGVQHFVQPGRPIHLLVGTGGIKFDGFRNAIAPAWSAYREMSHGYAKIKATKTSLEVEFVRKIKGTVADHFFIDRRVEASFKFNWFVFAIPVFIGIAYLGHKNHFFRIFPPGLGSISDGMYMK